MNTGFHKFDLTGRSALVTGGATGLGYYMARGLLRSGANVMLAARREDVLQDAASRLRTESDSGKVCYHRVDLSQRESIESLAGHAIETLGSVDIFIGNAAQDAFEPIEQISDAAIDEMFQVNVSANIELVRAFLPGMRQRKWGRIMFSSSTTSVCSAAEDNMGVYSATKSALNAFARVAAAEAGHDGITINSLLLGSFVTEMLEALLQQMHEAHGPEAAKGFLDSIASMTALGRWARADEIEGLIQFVASDAASYLTGASLTYDGGFNMMLRPHTPPTDPIYPNLSAGAVAV